MGDWDGIDSFADEFNVISIDIFNDHDSFFGQKVKTQVINGISQDGFLNE